MKELDGILTKKKDNNPDSGTGNDNSSPKTISTQDDNHKLDDTDVPLTQTTSPSTTTTSKPPDSREKFVPLDNQDSSSDSEDDN